MSSSVTAYSGYMTFGIGIALMSHPNEFTQNTIGLIMVVFGSVLLALKSK